MVEVRIENLAHERGPKNLVQWSPCTCINPGLFFPKIDILAVWYADVGGLHDYEILNNQIEWTIQWPPSEAEVIT
jgi:hypothetical protein